MEKKNVDLYLTANAKFFNEESIPLLRQKLEKAEDDNFAALQAAGLKDPTTLLLVSIFLGVLGIDRFMLGDTGIGILKLLTGGCCGILTIYDWFTVSRRAKEKNMAKVSMIL